MKVIIDYRESKLIDECKKIIDNYKNITIETKNLEIGDIIIQQNDNDKIIIERKSIDDLISSIKDGRYNEQSMRLNGIEHENHNIMYLIEGSLKHVTSQKQMVYSSIFSINYFKGFSVYRSDNVADSAYLIFNMASKLFKEKDRKNYYPIDSNNTECKEYVSVIKKKKSDNINKDNFLSIVLCQIPSISESTALAISKEYKTLPDLLKSIKENKNCLDTITHGTSSRKISKTSIKNILDFLS